MSQAVLSQLAPFNEDRFDAVMGFISARSNRTFDQYELMKLHVLIDVFHVLKYGRTVIGGQLYAWPLGPVMSDAYYYAMRDCPKIGHLMVTRIGRKRKGFTATSCPTREDFSESEMEVMREAWRTFIPMSRNERETYFHTAKSFLGRAYMKAKSGQPDEARDIEMSWADVIDEYAAEMHLDADYVAFIKNSVGI